MSDHSQSLLRVISLAAMIAVFTAVWNADAAQTKGMSLAERNRRIVPAHALAHAPKLAARPPRHTVRREIPEPAASQSAAAQLAAETELASGTYRVVHADGRVEWLTVIDREGTAKPGPSVITTTLGGQPVHLIRVTQQAAVETPVR